MKKVLVIKYYFYKKKKRSKNIELYVNFNFTTIKNKNIKF